MSHKVDKGLLQAKEHELDAQYEKHKTIWIYRLWVDCSSIRIKNINEITRIRVTKRKSRKTRLLNQRG